MKVDQSQELEEIIAVPSDAEQLRIQIKEFARIALPLAGILLAYGTTVMTSMYNGAKYGMGMDAPNLFPTFLVLDVMTTAAGSMLLKGKSTHRDSFADMTHGAMIGIAASTVLYTAGFGLGYAGGYTFRQFV
jgi:hypothetical protein